MKNLKFHSLLRWKMIRLPVLTNSLKHFFLKGWENVLLERGSERVDCQTSNCSLFSCLPVHTRAVSGSKLCPRKHASWLVCCTAACRKCKFLWHCGMFIVSQQYLGHRKTQNKDQNRSNFQMFIPNNIVLLIVNNIFIIILDILWGQNQCLSWNVRNNDNIQ